MLNPDKQTVADLKAQPKTTIAAVHGVSLLDPKARINYRRMQ